MDISFSCQACGQHLVIDAAGAGLVIECPNCGKDVNIPKLPDPQPNSESPPSPAPEEQKERTVALKWTPPPSGTRPPIKK